MKTTEKHEFLKVSEIELDLANPRIARFLEIYDGPLTPEQIFMALGAGGDESDGSSGPTFHKLKQSILTNGGVIQPIVVNRTRDSRLICIEGNTRVALYGSFLQEGVDGNWSVIPALVYDDLDEEDRDAVRLQAHLVGPRQWDPYSKAKYLSYLRNKEHFPFSKLVDYCGGNQKAVKESIDAYADMEKYYRPLLESDSDFDTRRFSGFVELQKPTVKSAISKAGFSMHDFATWIHERKIDALAEVRWLPSILKDKKATDVFLKAGAAEAYKVLDRPDLSKTLQEAGLSQLARGLTQAIRNLAWKDIQRLKEDPTLDTHQYLRDTRDVLSKFIDSISEE
jgi:hypothetical protein